MARLSWKSLFQITSCLFQYDFRWYCSRSQWFNQLLANQRRTSQGSRNIKSPKNKKSQRARRANGLLYLSIKRSSCWIASHTRWRTLRIILWSCILNHRFSRCQCQWQKSLRPDESKKSLGSWIVVTWLEWYSHWQWSRLRKTDKISERSWQLLWQQEKNSRKKRYISSSQLLSKRKRWIISHEIRRFQSTLHQLIHRFHSRCFPPKVLRKSCLIKMGRWNARRYLPHERLNIKRSNKVCQRQCPVHPLSLAR